MRESQPIAAYFKSRVIVVSSISLEVADLAFQCHENLFFILVAIATSEQLPL
jgi:hypothetical protein